MRTSSAFGSATRANALSRLSSFMPNAGIQYSQSRNTDPGPDKVSAVSKLSPFVRRRLVLEQELVAAAINEHGEQGASAFVSEVVWRTYFKGWLELRPTVWNDYLESLKNYHEIINDNKGLRSFYEVAIEGKTGIQPFDFWVCELREHGYLHNHARMWFASIWIFTLQLPWELGAEFFMRHLLDGDAASNTCSWRWIGGRHTVGKTYLARSSNIARFTNRRFEPDPAILASHAPAPQNFTLPAPQPVRAFQTQEPGLKTGFLVTHDDCYPESLNLSFDLGATIATETNENKRLQAFEAEALEDVRRRNRDIKEALIGPKAVAEWAEKHALEQIVLPFQPVGPVKDALTPHLNALEAKGVRIAEVLRGWDAAFWPHATAGFFKVKKRIPTILNDVL